MEKIKLVIAGGTGFLGQAIIKGLKQHCREIVVLSRQNRPMQDGVHYVQWDGKTAGAWVNSLEGAEVWINLTGRSVDCRYTEANKKAIIESRINATKALESALLQLKKGPSLWMNAASATIYGYSEDRLMDEFSGVIGEGFSVEVCKAWEKVFNEAQAPGVRKVTLRISMILGKDGGVFPVLKRLSKFFLGGTMGHGRQYISWMHEEDFVQAIQWFIQHPEATGAYNLAAPEPMPNKQFMQVLRKHLRVPFGLPATAWMLEIGAFFLRTETELVLKSRKVAPTRLLNEGFRFQYPTVQSAIQELCA